MNLYTSESLYKSDITETEDRRIETSFQTPEEEEIEWVAILSSN